MNEISNEMHTCTALHIIKYQQVPCTHTVDCTLQYSFNRALECWVGELCGLQETFALSVWIESSQTLWLYYNAVYNFSSLAN